MQRRTLLQLSALLAPLSTARAHGEGGSHGKTPPRKEQQAWGVAGEARAVRRTVDFSMTDQMRFVPDLLRVKLGETLRLRVHNHGKVLHEFVLGTRAALEEHAALMLKFPDMEHDEPWMAHVPAGRKGQIVWHFNRPGEFEFACLIAGHFQAGMRGRVVVSAA